MGLDVRGIIVVGRLVINKEIYVESIKFDPDTGIPYTKKEKSSKWFFEDGSEVPQDQEVHYDCFEGSIGVVGQEIDCSTNMRSNDPKQHCKKIDLQKVIDCLDKMKTEHKDSRVYNLLYMSY